MLCANSVQLQDNICDMILFNIHFCETALDMLNDVFVWLAS